MPPRPPNLYTCCALAVPSPIIAWRYDYVLRMWYHHERRRVFNAAKLSEPSTPPLAKVEMHDTSVGWLLCDLLWMYRFYISLLSVETTHVTRTRSIVSAAGLQNANTRGREPRPMVVEEAV